MRDNRGSRSGRGDSRRRARRVEGLLEESSLESLDERLGTRTSRRTEHRRPAEKSGLTLTHIAFLLAGLAVGATLLAVIHFLGQRAATPPAEEPPAADARRQPKPRLVPPARVTPRPIASDDPTTIVRAMLQAALDKDKPTAYAYWALQPSDIAYTGGGLQATLEECIDLIGRSTQAVKPSAADFRVDKRSGNGISVGQYVNGVCTQVYNLKRQDGRWRIVNATLP